MRLKRVLACCSSSCSSWSVAGVGAARLGHRPGAPADQRHAHRPRARRGRHRRPRRDRHRPHHAPTRRTTCSSPRATSTPRSGCGRWRSGGTSRPGGSPRCSARASSTPTGSSGRSAGGSAAERDLAAMAPEARAVLDAYAAGRQRLARQATADSLGLAFLVTGHEPGAVDRARHGRPGARSRPGTSAATWTRRCSGTSPTRGSATRRGPTSCSRPIARTHRSSRRPACRVGRRRRDGARRGDAPADRADPLARRDRPSRRRPPGARSPISARLAPAHRRTRRSATASPRTTASARTTGSSAPGMSTTGGALLANDPHLGHLDAVDLVHQRAPLRAGHATPARTTWRASRSRACPASSSVTTRASRGAPRTSTRTSRTWSSRRSTRPTRRATCSTAASLPFEIRTEEIRSRARPEPILRRSARRSTDRSSTTSTSAWPTRRSWPALDGASAEPDRTFEAILGLNTAADFEDVPASLSLYGTPTQNFVYADVDGHIGYQLPGLRPDPLGPRRPRRSPGPRRRRQRRVDRPHPVRRPALAARSRGRRDRDRQQRGRRRRRTRTSWPRNGIRASGRSGSATLLDRTARTA